MNGLAQITVDGQQVVLKFGLPALRRIYEKMKEHRLVDEAEQYNELGLCHILYAGYVNACAMKDKPATIPFEEFYNYVEGADDEAVKEEIISAIRIFEDSKYVKDLHKKKAVTSPSQLNQTGPE